MPKYNNEMENLDTYLDTLCFEGFKIIEKN